MAGTGSRRRRRQLQRQKERKAAAPAALGQFKLQHLPPDLLPEIRRRLATGLTRLAFTNVCGALGHHMKPDTPWLMHAKEKDKENDLVDAKENEVDGDDRATVWSLTDGESATVRISEAATVRISEAAMRGGHVVAIGSSGGWLVTADDRAALRMANPATGAHADLPPITTAPFIHPIHGGQWLSIYDVDDLYPNARSYTITAAQMRQVLYRKVVLSESPRPGSYAAMLIVDRSIGALAFATTEDGPAPSWRMARCLDGGAGVEDAIHHDGRFVSITYAGRVEAWRRDAETGEFVGEEVAPRLSYDDTHLRRKYLAASTDGRLMAVLKHAREENVTDQPYSRTTRITRVFFKVQILDRVRGRWEEAPDIGDTALFVGVNESLCLSTREHQGIEPGCVYFTDDEVGPACLNEANSQQRSSYGNAATDDTELRDVGVYDLKAGRRKAIPALDQHKLWPPPVWFTPSFS